MKFFIAIVVSLLLMLCLASLLESWDELFDVLAAFVLLLLYLALVVSIQWARASRENAKEEKRKRPDRKQAVPFLVPVSIAKGAERKQLEREQADLEKFMAQSSAGQYPAFNAIVTGVALLPSEQCCAVAQNVELVVPNSNIRHLCGCHGVSFRIVKGVRYDVSAYKGNAVTVEQVTVSDRGRIYVTDRQVAFAGTARILTIKLEQIEDVRVYADGVAVYQLNKQSPFVFRFNYGSSILAAAIRAMVDQTLQPPANQQNR